ncbi:MAG: MBL fold metallo-hydrolase [Acidobacteriota bacterium]|jgi:glyoxylase-like metal-dependent hydrolase (beta-lactamase superfamily II)|nr:MAG: hypothetical protein DIU54_09230 [Acidobacteriota bacterium]
MAPGDPILLPAGNPGPYTGEGNNTWLIDGAQPTLVDAGTGQPGHLEAIAEALDGRPLARVLVTHDHSDHASGVAAIRECWPDVEVLAVAAARSPARTLIDGERVPAGSRMLQVVYTPGHAADHVCFWDPVRRELFSGDLLLASGSVVIPAGRGGDLAAYLASLERVAALGPVRAYPGHGPVIDDPAATIAAAIERRRQREADIARLLDEGLTADAIVDRLYPDLTGPLRQAAALTVEAHIVRIRQTGPSR